MVENRKCWLCLRTSPSKILRVCRSLYDDDPNLAHEAGLKAAQLLRDAYLKSPTIVSGRSSKALIASAIYLVGVLDQRFRKTQWDVADATNAVQATVRKCSRLIAKTLGIPSRIEHWRLLPKRFDLHEARKEAYG